MSINLKNWVKYIGNQTLPVFNKTIQSVLGLTMDEKSSCKQLAETILKDAALTSRVIRVANSPYYNHHQNQLTDIRRIVLLIGFKKISEICLTLSILDSIVDNKTRQHVYTVSTKSFHAAIQARSISELYQLKDQDMVYMSALLYNIGEIAFWSLSGKSGRLISDLLQQTGVNNEQAEKNILGVTFRELSFGLVSEWKLSGLLKKALVNPASADLNIKCILFGHMISNAMLNNHSDFNDIAEKIAKESNISAALLKTIIIKNIKIANETYNYYLK